MRVSFLNIGSSDFQNGDYRHFCEQIEVLRQSKQIPIDREVVLLQYPTAFKSYVEKVGIYYDEEEVYIIDFYNSAGAEDKKLIYTFDEYYPLRKTFRVFLGYNRLKT